MNKQSYTPLALAALVAMGSYQTTRPIVAETAAGLILLGLGILLVNKDLENTPQERSSTPSRRSAPTKCFAVDIHTKQQEFDNNINALFSTSSQPYNNQRDIDSLKSKLHSRIAYRISTSCYANETAAHKDLHALVQEEIAEYIGTMARRYAERVGNNMQSNPPVNPVYINDINTQQFANTTKQTITQEVTALYKAGYSGSLAPYIGDALLHKIEQMAAQKYIRSTPKYGAPPSYEQATRPKNGEIYEIYPHENSPKSNQTRENLSNGKHHRSSECCICYDKYTKLGTRVNLPCGHDICPTCLYKIKYGSGADQNQACPQCRAAISNADFPSSYLRKWAHV